MQDRHSGVPGAREAVCSLRTYVSDRSPSGARHAIFREHDKEATRHKSEG